MHRRRTTVRCPRMQDLERAGGRRRDVAEVGSSPRRYLHRLVSPVLAACLQSWKTEPGYIHAAWVPAGYGSRRRFRILGEVYNAAGRTMYGEKPRLGARLKELALREPATKERASAGNKDAAGLRLRMMTLRLFARASDCDMIYAELS